MATDRRLRADVGRSLEVGNTVSAVFGTAELTLVNGAITEIGAASAR